ncbi:MAG: hypothetical protein F4X58_13275 [Chloroflexi bacterium]|nr:hypothetical protein [Chloroflexota bacterium]
MALADAGQFIERVNHRTHAAIIVEFDAMARISALNSSVDYWSTGERWLYLAMTSDTIVAADNVALDRGFGGPGEAEGVSVAHASNLAPRRFTRRSFRIVVPASGDYVAECVDHQIC